MGTEAMLLETDFEIFEISVGRDAAEARGPAARWLAAHPDAAALCAGVRGAVASYWSGDATLLHSPSLRVAAKWRQARGAGTLVTFAVEGAGFAFTDVGLVQRMAIRARLAQSIKRFRTELELAYPDDRFASSLFQVRERHGFIVSRADDRWRALTPRDAATRDVVEVAFAGACLSE